MTSTRPRSPRCSPTSTPAPETGNYRTARTGRAVVSSRIGNPDQKHHERARRGWGTGRRVGLGIAIRRRGDRRGRPSGAGQADRLRLRAQPLRPGPPGQLPRADDAPPGGRRDPPPRAHRHAPALLGRLRPLPPGARGRRPVVGAAHRQAAERGAGAARQPVPQLGRAFQGADDRGDGGARHRGAGGQPDARCTPPAPTATRSSSRCASAPAIDAILGRYRTKKTEADDDGPARRPASTSRTSPTARPAGGTRRRSRRTTTRAPS